jgi:hypothetical protein
VVKRSTAIKRSDPRIPFATILTVYAVLGSTWLGFNRNPLQILLTVLVGCLMDMSFHWVLHRRGLLIPLSAYISSLSIALVLNYSHNYYLLFLPVFFCIASKYVFTFQERHVFNPSLFGVVAALVVGGGLFSPAPAYQWGGMVLVSAFIATAGLALFVFRVQRGALIVSFLLFYSLQVLARAYVTRWHLPPEMLILGTLSAPTFYLFTFYMMTDPKTSLAKPRQQVLWALAIVLVDLWFHTRQSLYTLFFALFTLSAGRLLWLHGRAAIQWRAIYFRNTFTVAAATRLAFFVTLAFCGYFSYAQFIHPRVAVHPNFHFQAISPAKSGIDSRLGNVLNEVDPRVQHIAKWVLSVGDAIAVGDYDNDGLLDIFLTNPLKRPEDRNALYRNLGSFHFERVEIPTLREISLHPDKYGLVAGALFVDYDNSGAQSLLLTMAYGKTLLLKNMLTVAGRPEFVDVTEQSGIDEHTISIASTFFDYDRDGRLDLLLANSMAPYLPDYATPTPLNIFHLPQPEYPGDRRMFHFMHAGWHNAQNGGLNVLFHNEGDGHFRKVDAAAMGLPQTHWTIAVGSADLNHDGYTDLYCANDFGPDDLYLNDHGRRFVHVVGRMFGDIGKDTYKGMNVSIGDLDNRGEMDIYVSDVHVPLQAEGSLLWKTYPNPKDPFLPKFHDEATARGVLNEGAFAWGGAMGDIDLDGFLDIVQANGMVDDTPDKRFAKPRDYWYTAEKVMLSPPQIHSYADQWADLRGYEIFGRQANRVYLSRGPNSNLQFVDVASQVGLIELGNSRGAALADFDNDGALDLAITHQFAKLSLYRNTLHEEDAKRGTVHHWIGLTLHGDGKVINSEAVGTVVRARYAGPHGPVQQQREVQIENGFSAQGDRRLLFGLGDHDGPVELEISWYGRETQYVNGLALDHYHEIHYKPGSAPDVMR